MKKILISLIFGIMLISSVSASFTSLGDEFIVGQDAILKQLCGDCTYNNITSVTYPNSSVIITNQTMEKSQTEFTYILNGSSITVEGTYTVNGFGDLGGVITIWAYTFTVSKNGKILGVPESIMYIILSVGVFLLFLLCLYFTIMIPYANKSLTDGQIVGITKTKYIKLGLILITYASFTWFLNILIALSGNFISLNLYYGLFSFLFQGLNLLALPLFIIIFVWALMEIVRDIEISKLIDKFGSAEGKDNG